MPVLSASGSPGVECESEAFVVELGMPHGSPLVGASLEAAGFAADTGVQVLKLVRGGQVRIQRERTRFASASRRGGAA